MNEIEEGRPVIIRKLPDSCNKCENISICRENVIGNRCLPGEVVYMDDKNADVDLKLINYDQRCSSRSIKIPLEDIRIHPKFKEPGRYVCSDIKISAPNERNKQICEELIEVFSERKGTNPIFVVEYTDLITSNGSISLDLRGFFEDDVFQELYEYIEDDVWISTYCLKLDDICENNVKQENTNKSIDISTFTIRKKERKNFLE